MNQHQWKVLRKNHQRHKMVPIPSSKKEAENNRNTIDN
jgi:hypothetical protein